MRLPVFFLLFCFTRISFAQALEEKISDNLCECFSAIDRTLSADDILAKYQETCVMQVARTFESEMKTIADTIQGSSAYERGQKLGQLISTRTQLVMIDRCDRFFHLMDKLRSQIFETANEAEELLNIDAKSKQIQKTHAAADYYNRAISYFVLRKFKLAKADLDKAIELDQDYPASYLLRGFLFEQTKKYPEAITDYEISNRMMTRGDIAVYIAMAKRKQREQK